MEGKDEGSKKRTEDLRRNGRPGSTEGAPVDDSRSAGKPKHLTTRLERLIDGMLDDYATSGHEAPKTDANEDTAADTGSQRAALPLRPDSPTDDERSVAFTTGPDGEITSWHSAIPEEEEVPWQDGQILGDKWRLTRLEDSQTTFSFFYRGEHNILKMQVGVKILRRRFTATGRGRRLFHQEAMRVSLLHHPNIVKVLDYGDEGDSPYLVMEYLSGKPLSRYLREGSLSLEDGVEVVGQVTQALAHAHEGSQTGGPLVHLDLKPDHIFLEKVDGNWHVKVIDFGIAEIVTAPTGEEQEDDEAARKVGVAGTPGYMGLERFRGIADPRSDLWSLGVILYQIVAGRRPFDVERSEDKEKEFEAWRELLESAVATRPSSHGPKGPRSRSARKLDSLVLWLLARDLNDRPPSARAFLKSLEEWRELREAEKRSNWLKKLTRCAAVLVSKPMLALIALGLLYWGPWETLEKPRDLPVIGSPVPGESLEAFVHGLDFKYEGRPAYLLVKEEKGKVERSIELGPVENGRVRCPWPAGEKIIGALGGSKADRFVGRILVQRRFGLVLSSDSFTVPLDLHEPSIKSIAGGRWDDAEGTLYVLKEVNEIQVAADKPLDETRCRWGGALMVPVPDSEGGYTLSAQLNRAQDKADLLLVDRSGNETERTIRIEWCERPQLRDALEETVHTNKELFLLPLKFLSRCRVRVQVDNQLRYDDETEDPEVRIDFSAVKDWEIARRQVKIEASSLAAAAGAAFEKEWNLEVEYRRGDLRVSRVESGGRGLPSYEVLGPDGVKIPWDILEHAVTLDRAQGDQAPQIPGSGLNKSGRLSVEEPLKGRFQCVIKVNDKYGNTGTIEDSFTHPKPPEITRFELPTTLGRQPGHPLYKVEFLENGGWPEDETFSLKAEISYADLDALQTVLYLEDAEPGRRKPLSGFQLTVERKEYRATVTFSAPVTQWLAVLREGSNTVVLEVFDRDTREDTQEPRVSKSCVVYYDPLNVDIKPAKGRVTQTKTIIKVETKGWVQGVRLQGEPAHRRANAEGAPVFEREIAIDRVGETPVKITVITPDDREHSLTRKYSAPPVGGVPYRFPEKLAGIDLELVYFPGTAELRSFWYTERRIWRELAALHLTLHPGQKKERGEPGVTYGLAEKVALWLAETLPDAAGNVFLPGAIQLRAIYEAEPHEAEPPGWEWTRKSRSGHWSASVFHIKAGEESPANPEENYPFRLLFGDHVFDPKDASAIVDAKKVVHRERP